MNPSCGWPWIIGGSACAQKRVAALLCQRSPKWLTGFRQIAVTESIFGKLRGKSGAEATAVQTLRAV